MSLGPFQSAIYHLFITGLNRPLKISSWAVKEDSHQIGFTGLDRFAILDLEIGEVYKMNDGSYIERIE